MRTTIQDSAAGMALMLVIPLLHTQDGVHAIIEWRISSVCVCKNFDIQWQGMVADFMPSLTRLPTRMQITQERSAVKVANSKTAGKSLQHSLTVSCNTI
eukprot:4617917-Amphidinium_carterae.1